MRWGRVARSVFYTLAAGLLARDVFASEAKSDLALEVRVVESVVAKGALGRPAARYARIEVDVESFRTVEDVALSVERRDGRASAVRGTPLALSRLDWTDARGAVSPGPEGIVIPARGKIRTRFEVPIDEGAGVQTIVVRATAVSGTEEVSTESAVVVAMEPKVSFQDSEGVSNFPVGEVQ